MQILGVMVDDKLQFAEHVRATVTTCSRSLFALRTLRSHGLSNKLLRLVFRSSILSKLTYASPSFVGSQTLSSTNFSLSLDEQSKLATIYLLIQKFLLLSTFLSLPYIVM